MSCISITELNAADRAAIAATSGSRTARTADVSGKLQQAGVNPHHGANHAAALPASGDNHITDGANALPGMVSEGPAERIVDLGNSDLALVPVDRDGFILDLPDMGLAPNGPASPWLGKAIHAASWAGLAIGASVVIAIAAGWL